jgi:hypothetical protein
MRLIVLGYQVTSRHPLLVLYILVKDLPGVIGKRAIVTRQIRKLIDGDNGQEYKIHSGFLFEGVWV